VERRAPRWSNIGAFQAGVVYPEHEGLSISTATMGPAEVFSMPLPSWDAVYLFEAEPPAELHFKRREPVFRAALACTSTVKS
jgi:hypothetical protein